MMCCLHFVNLKFWYDKDFCYIFVPLRSEHPIRINLQIDIPKPLEKE